MKGFYQWCREKCNSPVVSCQENNEVNPDLRQIPADRHGNFLKRQPAVKYLNKYSKKLDLELKIYYISSLWLAV